MYTQFRDQLFVLATAFTVLTETSAFAHGGGGGGAAHHSGGGASAPVQRSGGQVYQHNPSMGQQQSLGQSAISRGHQQVNSIPSTMQKTNSTSGLPNNLATSSAGRTLNNAPQNKTVNQPPTAMGITRSNGSQFSQTNLPPLGAHHTNSLTSSLGTKNLPPNTVGHTNQLSAVTGTKNLPPSAVGHTSLGNQVANGAVGQKSSKSSYSTSKNLALNDLTKNYHATQSIGTNRINPKDGLAQLGAGATNPAKSGVSNQVGGSLKNRLPGLSGGSGSGGTGSGGTGSGGTGAGGTGAGGTCPTGQCGMNPWQILSSYLVVPVGGIPCGGYGGYGGGYGGSYGSNYDPLCYPYANSGVTGVPLTSNAGGVADADPATVNSPIANNGVAPDYSSQVVAAAMNRTGSTATSDQVVLMLAASANGSLNFGIDGVDQTIAPGTIAAFALTNGTKGEIRFENGAGVSNRYTLTSGESYEFYARNGAWDLRQKTTSALQSAESVAQGQINLVHFSTAAPPVNFSLDGAMSSIDSGATRTVSLANGAKSEIAFDNGNGMATRYTVSNGQTYEFFAKDGAWDLREKAIDAVPTPEKPRMITGRFAVINPAENNIPLSFTVNGEPHTVTAGDLQIVTTFDSERPQVALAGADGREVDVPVAPGKIYEFWDNSGVWNLREKVLVASDSNENVAEETRTSGS